MNDRTIRVEASGLAGLRRASSLGDLLFLFDCATQESTRLRPIADRLGITVQAASHTYRKLSRRGLVEIRSGAYRPSVSGISWLHRTLRALSDDVFARQQRLPIVRSCRAVAATLVKPGDAVVLELEEGILSARPGRGPGSHGVARTGGPRGTLLEIGDLEGILEIDPAEVRVVTLSARDLEDPGLRSAIARELGRSSSPSSIVGAIGLEAFHLAQQASKGPIVQFAAGSMAAEAARVGVPSTIVILDEDLPLLFQELPVSDRPRVSVRPISLRRTDRGGRRARRPLQRGD